MSQKYCPKCKVKKDTSEFGPNKNRKDGLQSMCNPCRSEYMKEWYKNNSETQKQRTKESNIKGRRENRERVLQYLREHPCIDCGNADIEVLEFDHRDAKTKKFAIGDAIRHRYGWQTIVKEIEKCDVRCANCHRKRSRKQLGWWRELIETDDEEII